MEPLHNTVKHLNKVHKKAKYCGTNISQKCSFKAVPNNVAY